MVRVIASLDDLHFADGERVEAAGTHVLILDGQATEIDLTDEHADELAKLIAPYFAAGRRPADPAVRGRGRHTPALGGGSGKRGMTGRPRAETRAARDWAREQGLVHLITTPAGGSYYKQEFVDKWDAHKIAAGLNFD
jgi:hypothetical protein